jgi:hypothetical protein
MGMERLIQHVTTDSKHLDMGQVENRMEFGKSQLQTREHIQGVKETRKVS